MTVVSISTPTAPPRSAFLFYLAVALIAGSVIALQISIMRIFSVGSWAHFGSMVVSLAMMGFGLTSVVMCAANDWFDKHWQGVANVSLLAFGPLIVAANLLAQQIPFNAIFLISDPVQKWKLFGNFVLYLTPFLAGAFFLGAVFLRMKETFGRIYFADLVGAGTGGLLLLGCLYLFRPENLVVVPLVLWFAAGVVWFLAQAKRTGSLIALAVLGVLCIAGHFWLPQQLAIPKLAVSDYKGVSYARKFPDNQRVYENASPFGYLEVYSSSYLHFAPGLSDNAGFNLPEMPANAYLGMYIDSEGPMGVMRKLNDAESAYFRYLPMDYPYVIKQDPNTFVVQFGGGISTRVALHNSKHVTVAEGNPEILNAFRNDKGLRDFSGDILNDPKLDVIDYDGRLYLANTDKRYDVIDLSLADSAGLSSPGGFAIVEKYAYTREAMRAYMRALADGGVLSVTLWNKEEPPKSVLKLYATMVDAARDVDAKVDVSNEFYAVASYLSTATVLYKRGGFSAADIDKLHAHTHAMSFDELTYPGYEFDTKQIADSLKSYRESIFGEDETAKSAAAAGIASGGAKPKMGTEIVPTAEPTTAPQADPTAPTAGTDPTAPAADPTGPGADPTGPDANASSSDAAPAPVPATVMGQLAWHSLLHGNGTDLSNYVFDARPLTNNRPYFAAYVKPGDLTRTTDRLELFQDEWGYLLLWATLGIAAIAALVLVAIPVLLGWRTIFSRTPGQLRVILYFACLGLGYIMVEVALIAKFVLPLGNPTVSASILITGMLVFSGLGSLTSERFMNRARVTMPIIFVAIGALLIAYGFVIDPILDAIGRLPYALRLVCCFLLIAPPAFLMGFPMSTAMTWLGRLGKNAMFLWAWGINGSFSVIGAALVPIIATSFGLATVLQISGIAYLIAAPAFFAIFLPMRGARAATAA